MRIDKVRIIGYNVKVIVMRFKELEKIILDEGWRLSSCVGSHYHYEHSTKKGKITIPNHRGDIKKAVVNSVLKQAQLK